ncbi:uncharacterized protein LAJ45_04905 [Morchella importuna]|uniref:uncharacterized protein n=1 Tax=Morchella importuna TaxID=1174673 RepID=UPI001E8D1217|nr:uncharacterized protein LAJ45_04905 [Morchella importuna]KAH8151203.1 hypothetical protein LAJ45_04905 [Morchella importuna]
MLPSGLITRLEITPFPSFGRGDSHQASTCNENEIVCLSRIKHHPYMRRACANSQAIISVQDRPVAKPRDTE